MLSGEVSRRWPDARWWASPLAYALAATPGLSRMYMNQHWASDVLMGAFIGVVAGQKVVRYNHTTNPTNRVNRFFLGSDADAATQEQDSISDHANVLTRSANVAAAAPLPPLREIRAPRRTSTARRGHGR